LTASDLAARLDTIVADLEAAGVTPTPLNIIAHALDQGMAEELAAAIAGAAADRRQADREPRPGAYREEGAPWPK
jgi:hypothetical protein